MANTRQSAKRARQAEKRQDRNKTIRSSTRTSLRAAIESLKAKDLAQAKEAYMGAVKTLSKAASKGAIPKARAARKISRLTALVKKLLPATLGAEKAAKAPAKAAKAK
jgi:small subunit ribosomal protein S20